MAKNMSETIEIDWKDRIYAIWMFVKLRYTQWSFYYTKWVVEQIGFVATMVAFYFFSNFVGGSSLVEEYGGNYTAFLLLGFICSRFFTSLQEQPYARLHEAFYGGSLQMYLLSPIGVWSYMLSSMVWLTIYWTAMSLILNLAVGYFFLGVDISLGSDPITLTAIFALTILSMIGLSFISCSTFSLLNAKGYKNPLRIFTFTFEGLLAGVYFPITLLPSSVQSISTLLPHFYAYRSLRLILLANATISNPTVMSDLLTLAIFTAILLPLGVFLFELGLRKAKKDGNLTRWV